MVPELIVPDLSGFKLKPYVSYKTEIEIKKRLVIQYSIMKSRRFKLRIENSQMKSLTSESPEAPINLTELLTKEWPPPSVTPRLLFDHFYFDKIRDEFRNQIKEEERNKLRDDS
jgi:hypothetical protein